MVLPKVAIFVQKSIELSSFLDFLKNPIYIKALSIMMYHRLLTFLRMWLLVRDFSYYYKNIE